MTASVLENRRPCGVYFNFSKETVRIANFTTQTNFHYEQHEGISLQQWITDFINESNQNDLSEIRSFSNAERKRIKFQEGDFYSFKLNRREYGFGRILCDIEKLRARERLVGENHGLNNIMGKPVLVKVYMKHSQNPNICLKELKGLDAFPSEFIFDNRLLYGEYKILGNHVLEEREIEFPISYGKCIEWGFQNVFFQWGLIHKELAMRDYSEYLLAENKRVPVGNPNKEIKSPFRRDSIGYSTSVDYQTVKECAKLQSLKSYWDEKLVTREFDLRNPKNDKIRKGIFKAFGLDTNKNYFENLMAFKES